MERQVHGSRGWFKVPPAIGGRIWSVGLDNHEKGAAAPWFWKGIDKLYIFLMQDILAGNGSLLGCYQTPRSLGSAQTRQKQMWSCHLLIWSWSRTNEPNSSWIPMKSKHSIKNQLHAQVFLKRYKKIYCVIERIKCLLGLLTEFAMPKVLESKSWEKMFAKDLASQMWDV